MTTDHTELDAFIESLGLTYVATFVPQSQSRNAKAKERSLNWLVTISKNGRALATDYMQGIAHMPGYQPRETLEQRDMRKYASENGLQSRLMSWGVHPRGNKPIPAPLLRDVLYCLVLDASVLDVGSFEEWAREFNYDTDSRQAEATYRACLDIALQLHATFGTAAIEQLRALFQDY